MEDLDRAIELVPELPEARYNRGLVRRDLGRMEEALEDFSAAIGMVEHFGLAFYARGITHLNLESFDAALDDFNAVLFLDPDSAAALRAGAWPWATWAATARR